MLTACPTGGTAELFPGPPPQARSVEFGVCAGLLAPEADYNALATYLAAWALLIIGLSALASIFVRLSRLDG